MPTILLPLGNAVTLVANQSYALPARVVRVTSNAAVTTSLDGTTFTALTGADTTGVETSAVFLKAATAAIVVCKAL